MSYGTSHTLTPCLEKSIVRPYTSSLRYVSTLLFSHFVQAVSSGWWSIHDRLDKYQPRYPSVSQSPPIAFYSTDKIIITAWSCGQ